MTPLPTVKMDNQDTHTMHLELSRVHHVGILIVYSDCGHSLDWIGLTQGGLAVTS